MTSKAATEFDRKVGARIATYREVKNLSQNALGVALGVTRQQIQKYEKGSDRLRASRLRDIAKFLHVPMSALLSEETDLSEGDNLLVSLSLSGATELLKAYAAIGDVEMRRDILALVSTIASAPHRPIAVSS